MQIRIRLVWLVVAALAGVLFYAGHLALRAHRKLVTLNVRDLDVHKVVRKLEWQTWQTVYVAKDVKGKITLNVRNAPLDEVLSLVAGQVSARSAWVVPIYRSKRSLNDLANLLRQDTAALAEAKRWTNFTGGDFGRGGRFGGGFEAPDVHAVNLSIKAKEASLAAVTLAVATRTQIIPEDGLDTVVNLEVQNAAPSKAIALFAKTLNARWTSFYCLRAARFDFSRVGPGPDDEEAQQRRTQRMEARLDAMTPEQRARLDAMRNLTPEERQAQMQARMEDPAAQQRMVDRALNNIRTSTPEQMVERKRQRMQMAQNGNRPGPRNRP